jgi:tRNA A-37 threonylcarbamoyl transferase component Bud32/WD40 repeat protein
MIGRTLNHYRVEAKLGAGGMGEVYRAVDTTLDREVAIKVLARTVTLDVANQLQRLKREARLLASLNHPNIATVHGLEECEGELFLVMELVPGQTLTEAIATRPPSLTRAIDIARQIAEALWAAHDKGIVHRDLKPGNIRITPDGTVKVLDFGLAKSDSESHVGAGDAATAEALTAAGSTVGTVGYMSPEQATGDDVDRRTDIWAFGCVLYELVTARRAFGGTSISDSIAATLSREPDWTALPSDAPPLLRKILNRCLTKDRRRRYQDMGDVRLELDEVFAVDRPAAKATSSLATAFVLLLAAIGLAAGVWYWGRSTTAEPGPWTGQLLGGPARAIGPRVSPDGQTLAFQTWVDTQNQVAILKPASGHWNVLTHERSDGSIMDISWSPDGSRIYYDRFGNGVFSVPVVGGEPRRILDNALGPQAIADGSLLVTRVNEQARNQLYRFWPDEQRLEPLPVLLPPTAEAWAPPVRAFPDGAEAVFFGRSTDAVDAQNNLHVIDLRTKAMRRLAEGLTIRPTTEYFALSVDPTGEAVLVDYPEGDLHHILELPRRGGARRQLLTLTTAPWFLDASRDGSIYVDQVSRPFEIIQFPASGGVPTRVAVSPNFVNYFRGGILPLPDGRTLLGSSTGGRGRLLVTAPGQRLIPFIDTTEETSTPAAVLNQREVAFLTRRDSRTAIAIASIQDARIVRRLEVPAGEVTAMAASPDGRTIYCVSSRAIWAVPVSQEQQGRAAKIGEADAVTVDPRNGDLIAQIFAADGSYRLFRRPAGGGPEQEISVSASSFFTYPVPLSPTAVGRDGRILLHGGSMDTWNFRVGIVDPRTNRIEVVSLQFDGDPAVPGWTADGHIVSIGLQYRMNIWRFQRTSANKRAQ